MAEIIRVGFGENTGTTAADSSGNGRNITSVPGWTTSFTGHGTAMARATAGTGGQFTLAADLTEWTMMFWVRVRTTGTWASIVEQPFTGTSELFIEVNGLALDVFHRWLASGGEWNITSGTLTTATWTHLAYTYNATTNTARMVINGTTNGTATVDNALLKTGGTYYLGGSPSQGGNMDVDDFRVFNVGMTDSEIAAVMNESVEGGGSTGTGVAGRMRLGAGAGVATVSTPVNATGSAATMRLGAGSGAVSVAATGNAVGSPGQLSFGSPSSAASASAVVAGSSARLAVGARSGSASTTAWRYITAVSSSGRYFVDQLGSPILVKGDSPWGAPTKMSTSEWSTYCTDRSSRGFNAALFSLIGSGIIGSNDNGATYDGVLPFVGGDVTNPNATYWARMDTFLDIAEANGITVFVYPIDGWTILGGRVFDGISATDCQTFGTWLATRWASRPNIVWMFGGDYSGFTAADNQMGGCLAGIRSTGDTRPASCQMIYQRSWTGQYTYWKARSNFWHIYSYPVQYDAVYAAYQDASDETPKVPALFMEGYYGGENDGTNALTIRKQAAWAMTQGSPGHFYGSDDWDLFSGWQSRLGSYSVTDVARIHLAVEAVAWWKLAPSRSFITSGAGTLIDASGVGQAADTTKDPSQSTYASAAVAADGSLAMVYLPTQRAITINTGLLGASPVGTWISTATLAETSAGSLAGSITPPAAGDWLLRVDATPVTPANVSGSPAVLRLLGGAGSVQAGATVAGSPAMAALVGGTGTATTAAIGAAVGSPATLKAFGGLGVATGAAAVGGSATAITVAAGQGAAIGGAAGSVTGSPAALWVRAGQGVGETGAFASGTAAALIVVAGAGSGKAAASVSGFGAWVTVRAGFGVGLSRLDDSGQALALSARGADMRWRAVGRR